MTRRKLEIIIIAALAQDNCPDTVRREFFVYVHTCKYKRPFRKWPESRLKLALQQIDDAIEKAALIKKKK